MIHQPEGGSQGQASEVLAESEEVMQIRRQVEKTYACRKLLTDKSTKAP